MCFNKWIYYGKGFPGGSDSKESACNVGDLGSIPGKGRFPWRKEWQPTPVFLSGEAHGQRSLSGYSPWRYKESDTTEGLTLSYFFVPYPVHSRLSTSNLGPYLLDARSNT